MAAFFFITLCISALGLLTLIGLKRREMRTHRVMFARARPAAERGLHALVLFVQYMLPFMARRSLGAMYRAVRAAFLRLVARGVLLVEETLHRLIALLQGLTQPPSRGGAASSFLQEVADHKKSLLRKPLAKRAIFEEYQQ